MSTRLRLDDVRRAWESSDPELSNLVVDLAGQADDKPETPPREGAPTFARFLAELHSPAFARKPADEQKHRRIEQFKALESPTAEVPLPDRLRLHEVITALWEDNGPFARSCLMDIIARVPLKYGPWRALKRIFKEAEACDDTEVFGALAARVDSTHLAPEVTARTLAYLRRRAWRYLRRTGQTRPACYADVAADVLAHYEDTTPWHITWVANHIFYHETGDYNRSSFHLKKARPDLNDRAFADLWRRSPRPLFGLLERARSDRVRQFAADCLKADFRASLRDVEPGWVARLVGVGSGPVDEFVVWILTNVPKFEQGAFRSLGLHEAVLRLFDSPWQPARVYAAEYARTHARDLPLDDLIRLADNGHEAVRRLAADLLQSRDPRKEVGLEAWGRLLESQYGLELAKAALHKHFGARELTPDWFRDRLFTRNAAAFDFVQKFLLQIHPAESLGPGYFVGLIEAADAKEDVRPAGVARFAMSQLARFDVNTLDRDVLRRLILRPATTAQARAWVDEGRLKPQGFGLDFLKALAFHPDWETDSGIAELRRKGPAWARELKFDEPLSEKVLEWLGDVRRFAPADLGFEWLLKLAARGEPRYHNFAVATMIKGFTPADFAPKVSEPAGPAAVAEKAVDLGGASFLFTGKLATMQRKEAEDKVRGAGGAVASSVNHKLHYLVIGDEGSPLYGHGKKGTKQLKGEELNAAGANIRIISETAFLKMLSGHVPQASQGDAIAGAERLWEMAVAAGPGDAPLARFAMKYILRHHPDIALAETDRPVDPGAEVPAEFLVFDRVKPLFAETRKPLRDLALELARWEFARWSPPADELVLLAESPHADVRRFVAQALLADDAPEHRRYRIDPDSLTPAAVYRFCESADESTRALGMRLIDRSPRFRQPEELFRLTESPDRRVRAFVIRALWSLYRDRGITEGWKPYILPATTVGAAAKKAAQTQAESRGTGPPARPEQLPASLRDLWSFLRRTLFEISPPRPEKRDADEASGERLKPFPARKAKIALVETMRDLALEDADFARVILPILDEFMTSRGASERAACLVATTRIRHTHDVLRLAGGGGAS
ncbi:MAG: BRCT domain-containing protein [Isosphaeraceae bacterium]